MATKLRNLVITKVALVDEGSCSAAHIKLYKRKGGEGDMNFEQIMKSLSPEQQAIVKAEIAKNKTCTICGKAECTCKAEYEKACADKKSAEDRATAAEAELEKMKGQGTQTEEELLKNVDPAIRALIEKSNAKAAAAEAVAKQMQEERFEAEAISKAKEVPNIGTSADELKDVFKSLRKTDAKICDTVFNVLKAADALIAKGGLGTSGTTGGQTLSTKSVDEAWNKIEVKAGEIAKAKSMTKEAAISEVIKLHPEMYQAYLDAELGE